MTRTSDIRDAIALAIYQVASRWVAPNYPPGHQLLTFDQLDDNGRRLHFDYAEAVLALDRPADSAQRPVNPDMFSPHALAAYADVVRQGDAIYRQEQNDFQDRRAIRTFVDRFRPLAALA